MVLVLTRETSEEVKKRRSEDGDKDHVTFLIHLSTITTTATTTTTTTTTTASPSVGKRGGRCGGWGEEEEVQVGHRTQRPVPLVHVHGWIDEGPCVVGVAGVAVVVVAFCRLLQPRTASNSLLYHPTASYSLCVDASTA